MLSRPRFLLLLPLAALLGCGSSPSSPSSTTPYNFNGEWHAIAPYISTPQGAPVLSLDGPLQVSTSGAVTGTLTQSMSYGNIVCAANAPITVTVTGTLDDSHELSLTFPIAGGTGTLIATLANDPTTYGYGAWQVVGGSCAMSETGIVIKGTPSTPSGPTSPVPITANLSGNWLARATYNPASNGSNQPIIGFYGSLQFANGSVTGTLSASGAFHSSCTSISNGETATATGTLDANNNLTLTLPVAGGTATITATLGSNPQTLADGSYQIVGGNCPMAATPMTIAQYAPLTGTYTGTFNVAGAGNVPVVGSSITVTAVLTESSTANANEEYPLHGTVTVTGACTDSFTLSAPVQFGNGFNSNLGGSDFAPTASAIYDAFFFCGSPFSVGTLTRQ